MTPTNPAEYGDGLLSGWLRYELRQTPDGWSGWAVHEDGEERCLDNFDGELAVIFNQLFLRIVWPRDL